MKIIKCGAVYSIQDDNGRFWIGPTAPRSEQWQAPREPGAGVPCWMTTSLESAEAQAALLDCCFEPTIWERIADELSITATSWRDAKEDPANINFAVACALRSVSDSILKAIKFKPK